MRIKMVGGPRNGSFFAPRTRPPQYLSDQGKPITPEQGDRLFSGRDLRRNVRHQSGYRMTKIGKDVFYVHSSIREL